jgi:hypothetical protein
MLRYKLRSLLILLAILPPLLWFGWTKYSAWKAEQERREAATQMAQQRAREQLAALRAAFVATQAQQTARQVQTATELMEAMKAEAEAAEPRILIDPPVQSPNEL